MAKLEMIEGIGAAYAAKLRKAGVISTNDLLKKGATPAGRKQISGASGIPGKLILEWTNHSDLFRIKGVGEEYADLLEEAVDTVVELGKRIPEAYRTMKRQTRRKARATAASLAGKEWVKQAKKLPRIIKY